MECIPKFLDDLDGAFFAMVQARRGYAGGWLRPALLAGGVGMLLIVGTWA